MSNQKDTQCAADKDELSLSIETARFFGRITANATHEYRNILAIIRENAGLVTDIMDMMENIPEEHHARITRVMNSINQQIERGVHLSDCLNRFAHSADHVTDTPDISKVVDEIAHLMERSARQKQVVLSCPLPENCFSLECSPFLVRMMLGKALEYLLSRVSERMNLEAVYEQNENATTIHFQSTSPETGTPLPIEHDLHSPVWIKLQDFAKENQAICEPFEAGLSIILSRPL